MIPRNAENFDRPYLLLCEGAGDQRFFHRLIEHHQIATEFTIRYPYKEGAWTGGRPNFGADLNYISVNEDFIANVKAILVVSDRDDDPPKSFAEVQEQLSKVKGWPVPKEEVTFAKAENAPTIIVVMVPIDGPGNLETLCLISAYKKWSLENALNSFVDSAPAKEWGKSKQSKARIHAILAATNKSQPDAGFASHWGQPKEFQIPLDHECFNELVEFLKEFPALVAAA